MTHSSRKIVAIVGPTAVGKSSLGVRLARRFDGEVISADSRQVYRGLDIGTEKISQREMLGVPHHLIDIIESEESYSVADFKRDAQKVVGDIVGRNKLPIVVGGTGLYAEALIDDLSFPDVPPNESLRAELETLDTPTLFEKLEELDPVRAAYIDSNNKRRLVRAIEIATALGEMPSLERGSNALRALWIGLDLPDDELKSRIELRLARALERGLIEETERIHAHGVSWERIDELGLEYRLCAEHIRNELSREELERELKAKLWQYVKRQRTWFRRNERITWFSPSDYEEIEKAVTEFL